LGGIMFKIEQIQAFENVALKQNIICLRIYVTIFNVISKHLF